MAGGERHSLLCLWAMGTGEISPPDSKETPGSSLTIKLAALIQGLSLNKLEKESVFSLSPSFFSPSFAFCACLSVCLCLCVCVCVSECMYNQSPHTHISPCRAPLLSTFPTPSTTTCLTGHHSILWDVPWSCVASVCVCPF